MRHECERQLLHRGHRHHPDGVGRHDAAEHGHRPDGHGGQQQSDQSELDRRDRQRRRDRLPGRALPRRGLQHFAQLATPSTNSYSDPGLTAGTSYSYRVKAVDGAGNLSLNYSNTASATPQAVTNLVTAYGMNEGSGTTLADASGSGHPGTLVNGPAWVAGQATYGQALSFDGVNDLVSVANPASLNFGTADFTIELWAKRNVLGGAQRHLFSKCDSTLWQSGCKEFYFNPSNQLTFGSYATGDTLSTRSPIRTGTISP